MPTPTITQTPTSDGVLLRVTFTRPYKIIAYARDKETGRVWDIKEILSEKSSHLVSLKIPRFHGDTVIVVHPLAQ